MPWCSSPLGLLASPCCAPAGWWSTEQASSPPLLVGDVGVVADGRRRAPPASTAFVGSGIPPSFRRGAVGDGGLLEGVYGERRARLELDAPDRQLQQRPRRRRPSTSTRTSTLDRRLARLAASLCALGDIGVVADEVVCSAALDRLDKASIVLRAGIPRSRSTRRRQVETWCARPGSLVVDPHSAWRYPPGRCRGSTRRQHRRDRSSPPVTGDRRRRPPRPACSRPVLHRLWIVKADTSSQHRGWRDPARRFVPAGLPFGAADEAQRRTTMARRLPTKATPSPEQAQPTPTPSSTVRTEEGTAVVDAAATHRAPGRLRPLQARRARPRRGRRRAAEIALSSSSSAPFRKRPAPGLPPCRLHAGFRSSAQAEIPRGGGGVGRDSVSLRHDLVTGGTGDGRGAGGLDRSAPRRSAVQRHRGGAYDYDQAPAAAPPASCRIP